MTRPELVLYRVQVIVPHHQGQVHYQARARAFGMVTFLRNIRCHLGRPPIETHVVPGSMVRDIGLPPLRRN